MADLRSGSRVGNSLIATKNGTEDYIPKFGKGHRLENSLIQEENGAIKINKEVGSNQTLLLDREGGTPSIKATSKDNGWLIMDSDGTGSGRVSLNHYTSDHVALAMGGGNVGVGTDNPTERLTVSGKGLFQGDFGGYGLHIDSSTGAGIKVDRGTTSNAHGIFFATAGTNNYYIGNWGGTGDSAGLHFKKGGYDGTKLISFGDDGSITSSGMIYANGNMKSSGNLIVDNASTSHNPAISLAIGDSDTGFDWISDGQFWIKANNHNVAHVFTEFIELQDNKRVQFGNDNGMALVSNSSANKIEVNSNNLTIENNLNEPMAIFTPDSSVVLYYNGSKKLETTSSGINISEGTFQQGYNLKTDGIYAHAHGINAWATGDYSHAEGESTNASGLYSHAEGSTNTASGRSSHAEGEHTTSSGYATHTEGYGTSATLDSAHAEGEDTVASGYASHSQNYGTIAQGQYQTAIGKYNIAQGTGNSLVDTDYAFIVGNGTSDSIRSDALTVDWNGNVKTEKGGFQTGSMKIEFNSQLNALEIKVV